MAQLVEHIVHIDGVTGSSPVATTTKPSNCKVRGFSFSRLVPKGRKSHAPIHFAEQNEAKGTSGARTTYSCRRPSPTCTIRRIARRWDSRPNGSECLQGTTTFSSTGSRPCSTGWGATAAHAQTGGAHAAFRMGAARIIFSEDPSPDGDAVHRLRKGAGDRGHAAVVAQVVHIEDEVRSVGVLESLLRLKRLAQHLAGDDAVAKAIQQ